MKISIACPSSIHANQSVLNTLKGAAVTVEGALLHFEFQGDPITTIREWDEGLGLAIADATEAELIRAMSHLKAAVLDVERAVHRESSYSLRASESEEAAVDSDASQLHVQQHTSTNESSEQHGVAPLNEEIEIVETDQKEPASGFFGQRARADRR